MADCSKITAGLVAANCTQAPLSGIKPKITLLNYDDVDKSDSKVTNNIISAIVMTGTTKGYVFESLDESCLPETSLAKGTYFSKVQHDLTIRVFIKTEPAKAFVNNLLLSRVIAIVQNKELGTSGDTQYEAIGWEAGLIVSELKSTGEFADGVVYEIKLGSSDKSKEGTLPKSVFITDTTTTEKMLAGLVAAV
ncbi:MAG: hypothetical protein P4L28_12050 [Paludibacteraceae bacterium]|nr:hypothetical protein [Paludibacteraceae bacterium]